MATPSFAQINALSADIERLKAIKAYQLGELIVSRIDGVQFGYLRHTIDHLARELGCSARKVEMYRRLPLVFDRCEFEELLDRGITLKHLMRIAQEPQLRIRSKVVAMLLREPNQAYSSRELAAEIRYLRLPRE